MNPLIASIINNPSAHQVNRAEKMEATVNVMVDNKMKQESRSKGALALDEAGDRGYGKGKNTGD